MGQYWRHSAITIFCDNLGVVQVVETVKTKDPLLGLCIRNIWLLTDTFDIQLHILHIAGTNNVIAETLSRVYSEKPVNLEILKVLQDSYVWHNIPACYFDLNIKL